MSTHTPGPWETENTSQNPAIKSKQAHYLIARCILGMHPKHRRSLQEAQANARLIAAAPDLLAALHAIIDEYEHSSRFDIMPPQWLIAARAAIAKAEGTQS